MSVSIWDWIFGGGAGLCWIALLFAWSMGALTSVRQKPAGRKPLVLASVGIIVLACVILFVQLCIALLPTLRPIWQLLSFDVIWLRLPGLLLLLIATIFTLWARTVLGLMWCSIPLIKPDHRLRTSGPYRITRHPFYTGLLGMSIGTLLMLASYQWFVIVIESLILAEVLLILHLKIRFEERLLLATFGEDYMEYQKRVPRLLPFIR